MGNSEGKNAGVPPVPDRPIQLMVNRPQSNEMSINLGNVFYNMKLKKRLFTWVLVLCVTVGLCAPLLLYQFTKEPLTVSSVAILRYEAPVKIFQDERWVLPSDPDYAPVTDLSAPDGTDLDLNQITSAYVLQTALDGLNLSQPVTASQLRANIRIQTILTEESSRTKEALAGLAEAKNAEAYTRLETAEMRYQNRFVVSLTNGFGDEDSRTKYYLTDEELRQVLDRVLTEYNDYLVRTWADVSLPEDRFSAIDTQELDVLECVDMLRTGFDSLDAYIEDKTDSVKSYRSPKTGRSLLDWQETLKTFRSINVDYLYSLLYVNAATRDKDALLNTYRYQRRSSRNSLDRINEEIEETKKILDNYQNDSIYLSMQESDDTRSTKSATTYYNGLVEAQLDKYDEARELWETVADYEERISGLDSAGATAVTEEMEQELERSLTAARTLQEQLREHMEELFDSAMYTAYADHSVPQGREPNFLVASLKKMIIGAVAAAVIVCAFWFLAGLAPEFARNRDNPETGKEADV